MIDDKNYEGRDLEVLADMPHYHRWIMRWFAPHVGGRVIEYGAGTGTFSAYLRPLARHLTLVEPSTNLHRELRAKFGSDSAVEIVSAGLEEHVTQLATGTVDAVVLVNVLEHIANDRNALAELARIVAPSGHVLIFVPALTLLMSQLDRNLGHFRRYHRPDLREKMLEARLEILTCRYFDFPGTVPWLVINRILGSTTFNPSLVWLYDRACVPLARVAETLIAPPFGKNLIAIGRARAR